MTDVGNGLEAESSQLRERPTAKPLHMHDPESAKQRVLELNEQENSKSEREKRTYGRTPSGTGKYRPCYTSWGMLQTVLRSVLLSHARVDG
jgi:hypothetical protein